MARRLTLPFDTLDELLDRLGGISPKRVRMNPPPGTATEADVTRVLDRTNRPCELIDGTLVEKAMGAPESNVGIELGYRLRAFLEANGRFGVVFGADGTLRIMPGMVRIPDVSFVRRENLPNGRIPREPVPDLVPDLAVEVISGGNTPGEMNRKLRDYIVSGVRIVWLIDPATRSARVATGPEQIERVGPDGVLTAGEVLPGFAQPLAQILEEIDVPVRAARPKRKPRK